MGIRCEHCGGPTVPDRDMGPQEGAAETFGWCEPCRTGTFPEGACAACGASPGTDAYDNFHDSVNCWAGA